MKLNEAVITAIDLERKTLTVERRESTVSVVALPAKEYMTADGRIIVGTLSMTLNAEPGQ